MDEYRTMLHPRQLPEAINEVYIGSRYRKIQCICNCGRGPIYVYVYVVQYHAYQLFKPSSVSE